MGAMASQITSPTIVYSTVYSDADQRKYESSASLAFVRGIHRGPVNSPHKWPVTRKMSPFDDVIMLCRILKIYSFWKTVSCHGTNFIVTIMAPEVVIVIITSDAASDDKVTLSVYQNCVVTDYLAVVYRAPGLILGLRPANERRRYNVTTSLTGWAKT